jgi:hypothetical protein
MRKLRKRPSFTDPHASLVWLLGNLARATYVGSSDFVWPYSYNKCDPSIRQSQEINACAKVSHFGLGEGRGRGAPEIDILESMQGGTEKLPHTPIRRPYLSCSYQVSNAQLLSHYTKAPSSRCRIEGLAWC